MNENSLKQSVVLIADDDFLQRLPMRTALEQAGFQVEEAENGSQALKKYKKYAPDLVILDVVMPKLDGFATCQQLKQSANGQYLPILMITSMDDIDSINKAYSVGATDFLTKPVNWALLGHKVNYLLRSAQTSQALAVSEAKLKSAELEIIQRLGKASDYKDNETGNHIHRMSHFAECLAIAIGLDKDECRLILQAAPMHDVGKIGIPDHIILKPGKLTADEFDIIKTHTTIGANLLRGNLSNLLNTAHDIAISHHEKWDGTGYPAGLSDTDIPLYGRICAIADVFDALTSDRPYKKAWEVEKAYTEIVSLSGSHFDPFLVEKFKQVYPEFIKIKETYKDTLN